jgi:hypothetical protein
MLACGQTITQLPHWMQSWGDQSGDRVRDVALLPSRRSGGIGSVRGQGAHREIVAAAGDDRRGHVLDEVRGMVGDDRRSGSRADDRHRQVDFVQVVEGAIDRREILIDELRSLAAVGRKDGLLDPGDRLLARQHARDREEARLHHRIDTSGHAGVRRDPVGVDHEHADALADDFSLYPLWQVVPRVGGPERRIDQEHRPLVRLGEHLDAFQQLELMAGDETGFVHEVGRPDRVGSEAQV